MRAAPIPKNVSIFRAEVFRALCVTRHDHPGHRVDRLPNVQNLRPHVAHLTAASAAIGAGSSASSFPVVCRYRFFRFAVDTPIMCNSRLRINTL